MRRKQNHVPRKTKKSSGKPQASSVSTFNPSRTPWATRAVTQIQYTDEFDINLTNGVLSTYVFNANGLYDPDQTGGGHQPLGFDQYAVMYNRYRVLKVGYNVNFGTIASTGAAVRATVAHNNGSTIPARPAIFELANSRQGVIGPYGQALNLKGTFDLTRLNASPSVYRVDDRYSALVSGNPTEVMYIILGLFPNVTASCRVTVKFIYHVEFYDIETPGSSLKGVPSRTIEDIRKEYELSCAVARRAEKQ